MALLPPLNHAAHARTFQCLLYLDRRSGEELHRRPSPLLHFWVSPAVTYQLANLAEDSAITFRGRTSERHARFDRGSRGDREEGRKEGRKEGRPSPSSCGNLRPSCAASAARDALMNEKKAARPLRLATGEKRERERERERAERREARVNPPLNFSPAAAPLWYLTNLTWH